MRIYIAIILTFTFVSLSLGQSAKLSTAEHLRLARDLSEASLTSPKQAKAVYHYRHAATRGHVEAQAELAYHYLHGVGIRKSYVDAVDLAKLAAKNNSAYGNFIMGVIYMDGKGIPKSKEMAASCFRKALRIDNECWNALLFMGSLLEFQFKDLAGAEPYYRKAAQLEEEKHIGDGSANYRLGNWYEDGIFYKRSMTKAIYHFHTAWEEGDYRGSRRIGFLYYDGNGFDKNVAMAIKFFMIGAENNHADSQFTMAYCYFNGIGVAKSIPTSDKYVRLAAANGHEKAKELITNKAIGDLIGSLFGGGSFSGSGGWDSQSEAAYRASSMPRGLGGNGAQ